LEQHDLKKEETMSRIRLLSAIAGALAAGLSVATIAAATGGGVERVRDYTFGVGNFGPACWQTHGGQFCSPFNFTSRILAVQQGNQRAWGQFERHNNVNGGTFFGPVACITVDGNRAAIGGVLTEEPGQPGISAGDPYVIYVEDNGPPGGSSADQISVLAVLPPGDPDLALMPTEFPNVCPSADSIFGYAPLTSGDITVSESSVGLD
jgi:hypothetical protein